MGAFGIFVAGWAPSERLEPQSSVLVGWPFATDDLQDAVLRIVAQRRPRHRHEMQVGVRILDRQSRRGLHRICTRRSPYPRFSRRKTRLLHSLTAHWMFDDESVDSLCSPGSSCGAYRSRRKRRFLRFRSMEFANSTVREYFSVA